MIESCNKSKLLYQFEPKQIPHQDEKIKKYHTKMKNKKTMHWNDIIKITTNTKEKKLNLCENHLFK